MNPKIVKKQKVLDSACSENTTNCPENTINLSNNTENEAEGNAQNRSVAFAKITVKQLKYELGKLKLPKHGNKKVLIKHLTNALQEKNFAFSTKK